MNRNENDLIFEAYMDSLEIAPEEDSIEMPPEEDAQKKVPSALKDIVETGKLMEVDLETGKQMVLDAMAPQKARAEVRKLMMNVMRAPTIEDLQRLVYNAYLKFSGLGVM